MSNFGEVMAESVNEGIWTGIRISIELILLNPYVLGLIAIVVALRLLKVLLIWGKNKRIRNTIGSGEFIYYKDFEKNWISVKDGKKGLAGYKYNDRSGCYVITIHDDKITDGNYLNYSNIYIGQSVNVCQRVHNHFSGKGNGDVYADLKYGRDVYVQIVPCEKEDMNDTEKELIRAFKATKSYNRNKGGGARR